MLVLSTGNNLIRMPFDMPYLSDAVDGRRHGSAACITEVKRHRADDGGRE